MVKRFGKDNPFYGKKHTEETRAKMRKNHKGFTGCKLSEEHKQKISLAQSGSNNHHWKGGIKIHEGGYILIKKHNHPFCDSCSYIKRSRLVMEEKIGRFLKPEEVVHHINEIKDDDSPDNLQLFPNTGRHTFHHLHSKSW